MNSSEKVSLLNEFFDAPLADNRLANRLNKIAESFYKNPSASIPEACGDYASTVAAYRFFSNNRVNPEAILMSHREQTIERMKEHNVILAIQDTSTLDYKDHPATKGLGTCTTTKDALGLLQHTTLAVTEEGIPLGILSRHVWTRNPEEFGKRTTKRKRATENKESQKWLEGLNSSLEGVQNCLKVVTICDREADVYDFFELAKSKSRDLLVRVAQKRRLLEDGKVLIEEIEDKPSMGNILVSIPRDARNNRKPREANLSIKYCDVTIKPPKHHLKAKELPNIKLSLVLAQEINTPNGVEPISWLLLTTIAVETLEQAIEKIKWYKQRWKIERFHYILKSGCKIEELQLESVDSLQNALAVYSVVAWKLLWIKLVSEQNAVTSCDIVLEKHEWEALYCVTNKTRKLPENPPSMQEAVLMIAKLGGFLSRKSDGMPGIKVLWRGLQRLNDISQGWLIANLPITNEV